MCVCPLLHTWPTCPLAAAAGGSCEVHCPPIPSPLARPASGPGQARCPAQQGCLGPLRVPDQASCLGLARRSWLPRLVTGKAAIEGPARNVPCVHCAFRCACWCAKTGCQPSSDRSSAKQRLPDCHYRPLPVAVILNVAYLRSSMPAAHCHPPSSQTCSRACPRLPTDTMLIQFLHTSQHHTFSDGTYRHPRDSHLVYGCSKSGWWQRRQLCGHGGGGGPHNVCQAIAHRQQREGASGQEALPRRVRGATCAHAYYM